MPRDCRLGQPKLLDQVRNSHFTSRQPLQDRQPGGISESTKQRNRWCQLGWAGDGLTAYSTDRHFSIIAKCTDECEGGRSGAEDVRSAW